MAEHDTAWQDWKTVRKLGEGGFGTVYEIMRSRYSIEEHRALKVIRIPSDESDVRRMMAEGMDKTNIEEYYRSLVSEFIKEIAFLSELRGCAHIVTYDDYRVVKKQDGIGWEIYIMMELLTPLPEMLEKEPLPESEVRKLGEHICDALSVCHAKHILHRDIKADNIFVTRDGAYKLGDFGIARTVEKASTAQTRIGTGTYTAPEVYSGQPYDERADLYSLGVLLYRLLNDNRIPFLPPYPAPLNVQDRDSALTRRLSGEPLPRPAHGSDKLAAVVMKACAFRPQDRYRSADEMKAALAEGGVRFAPEPEPKQPDQNATILADGDPLSAPTQPLVTQPPVMQQPVMQQHPVNKAVRPSAPPAQPNRQPNRAAADRQEVRSSGISAGVAIIIVLIVLVLIGGGVTIFALLNNNAVNRIGVEEDTRYAPTAAATEAVTEAATEAPPTQVQVIAPKKTFTYTIEVKDDFTSPVPIQLFVDGETNTDEIKYIDRSGYYTFTTEVTKDADVLVTIDNAEYYTCRLNYDTGVVTQESYNDSFFSANIAR